MNECKIYPGDITEDGPKALKLGFRYQKQHNYVNRHMLSKSLGN